MIISAQTDPQTSERREAWFSEDDKYRMLLDINWEHGSILTVIGLNPSTATHLVNDPTIRRCIGFAKQFGCGGLRMLNAFSYRATNRLELFKVADPVGPENTIDFLREHSTPLTIAAWGTTIQSKKWKHFYRGQDIANALPDLKCLRVAGIHPEHPLDLPADLAPIPFSYAA